MIYNGVLLVSTSPMLEKKFRLPGIMASEEKTLVETAVWIDIPVEWHRKSAWTEDSIWRGSDMHSVYKVVVAKF